MKRTIKRLLILTLCCALLCCLVPCTQASAEITTGEYGGIAFTTFEDLKTLASRTYGEHTNAVYNGDEALVISENITIPENLDVYLVNATVAEGVTLIVSEGAAMSADKLNIQGVVEAHSSLTVYFDLTVSGTLRNYGYLDLFNECTLTLQGKIENNGTIGMYYGDASALETILPALENVTNADGAEFFLGMASFMESVDDAKTILAAANDHPDVYFEASLWLPERLTVNEDVTIPENIELYINGDEGVTLTLAQGRTLTNYGYVRFFVPTQINGTLKNEGKVTIGYLEETNQKLTIASGGSYTGGGLLQTWYAENPKKAVAGLDLSQYLVVRDTGYYDDWVWNIYPLDVTAEVTRLAGSNRFETAMLAADEMNEYYLGHDVIIVANGYNFADALSGSYLANYYGAPILLCWSGDAKYDYLNDAVLEYIEQTLTPYGTVYLLGGTSAVPQSLEDALNETFAGREIEVKRLAGKDRFETNLMILEEAGVNEGDEVLVCTSTNFADSLSASATGKPILLVFNEYGKLYGDQPQFLNSLKNCSFTVIGGENAVSSDLETILRGYGSVTRLAGKDRFETSVLVAQTYFEDPHTAVLAYAWNFPDGLCGGSLAYSMDAPLILTMTKYESQAAAYLSSETILEAVVLGGEGLISDDSVRTIFELSADDEIVVK